MKPESKRRDPGRGFGWLIIAAIVECISLVQFEHYNATLSNGFGVAFAVTILGMIGLALVGGPLDGGARFDRPVALWPNSAR